MIKMAAKETGAEENTEKDEGGSWWQSWSKSIVDTVKEKTSSTYEMVQKDLSEFYQTIQTDTAHVVVDAASKVQDQIQTSKDDQGDEAPGQSAFRQGFANILSSVSESLKTLAQEEAPSPGNHHAEVSASSPVYDRRRVKIQQIQTEVGTYCNEPEGPKDNFLDWQQMFDFDSKRGEMSDMLVKVPEIRAIYSKLVPSAVSHGVFWKRYFYKIHQFEMKEERRAALVARAETSSIHEEEYKWDSDDGDDIVETETGSKAAIVAVQAQVHAETKLTEQTVKIENDPSEKTEKLNEDVPTKGSVAETNDDPSFEVLSPKKTEDVDSGRSNSAKEIEYQREVSEGSLSWSNEGDEVDGSETGLSPSTSNRLSPSKDDSSSGSSVEFIQKVSDSSLVAGGKVQSTAGLRESNEAKSTGCSDRLLDVKGAYETRLDHSETASTGSWISVDDEIRVRKSKKEKFINGKESDSELTKSPESNRNSGSSSSSAVLVEKIECKSMDDDDNEDGDLDLDEDINEEELQKIMEKIKSKSGDLDDDDDDWEDWE
ncbi:BSD domain-containing protein 1-like [Rhopilema esculentum]|uniref:BSD domain-containing protein 1-like n=1 Tax=Rhopilema esculentum TaxID=499914 RepID=UPI0031DA2887